MSHGSSFQLSAVLHGWPMKRWRPLFTWPVGSGSAILPAPSPHGREKGGTADDCLPPAACPLQVNSLSGPQ